MGNFLQYALTGITTGSQYALIAIGFTIIYNCTQVVNFAQGEFVMLGAMIAAVMVTFGHVPLWAASVAAVAIVTVIGGLMGGSLLRPLRTGTTVTLIIITIGASIVMQGAARLRWGPDPIALPLQYEDRFIHIGGASINAQSIWVMTTTIVLVFLLWLFYRSTLVGRAMRACASCKPGAKLVGININRMTVLSFALGAGVGALGGVVMFPVTRFASYDMGIMLGMKGFCAAIVGGLGSFTGGIVAGVTLGVLESFCAARGYSGYKDAMAFVILLIILFVRPQGVFGGRKAG